MDGIRRSANVLLQQLFPEAVCRPSPKAGLMANCSNSTAGLGNERYCIDARTHGKVKQRVHYARRQQRFCVVIIPIALSIVVIIPVVAAGLTRIAAVIRRRPLSVSCHLG